MSQVENPFALLISRRLSIQPYLSRLPSFPRLTRRNAFACCFCSLPTNATKSPSTSSTRRAAAFPGTKYPSNHNLLTFLGQSLSPTLPHQHPRMRNAPRHPRVARPGRFIPAPLLSPGPNPPLLLLPPHRAVRRTPSTFPRFHRPPLLPFIFLF